MKKTDVISHAHAVSELLDKMSSCIEELNEHLEELAELRDDMEGEFEAYNDESTELTNALEQYIEERDAGQARQTGIETVLEKLFLFDSITPMTQPERAAVYQWALTWKNTPEDICNAAGKYLKEYREGYRNFSDLPFE